MIDQEEEQCTTEHFECVECGCVFATLKYLNEHALIHTRSQSPGFKCTIHGCNYRTNRQSLLNQHLRYYTHCDKRSHSCSICGVAFKQAYLMRRHVKFVHSDKSEKHLKCDQCDYRTGFDQYLQQHKRLVHNGDRPFKCAQCGATFKTSGTLSSHSIMHKNVTLKCDFCEKTFKTQRRLQDHKDFNHFGVKRNQCNECSTAFATAHGLRQHQLTQHSGEQPKKFVCSICGKRFLLKKGLRQHEQRHLPPSDNRTYKCDQCDMIFATSTSQRSHKVTHSDERPYSCNICGKHFKTKFYVRMHAVLHSEDRPYKCTVCQMAYRRPWGLTKHLRSKQHNDKVAAGAV